MSNQPQKQNKDWEKEFDDAVHTIINHLANENARIFSILRGIFIKSKQQERDRIIGIVEEAIKYAGHKHYYIECCITPKLLTKIKKDK